MTEAPTNQQSKRGTGASRRFVGGRRMGEGTVDRANVLQVRPLNLFSTHDYSTLYRTGVQKSNRVGTIPCRAFRQRPLTCTVYMKVRYFVPAPPSLCRTVIDLGKMKDRPLRCVLSHAGCGTCTNHFDSVKLGVDSQSDKVRSLSDPSQYTFGCSTTTWL